MVSRLLGARNAGEDGTGGAGVWFGRGFDGVKRRGRGRRLRTALTAADRFGDGKKCIQIPPSQGAGCDSLRGHRRGTPSEVGAGPGSLPSALGLRISQAQVRVVRQS